jgi:hypothetical protein
LAVGLLEAVDFPGACQAVGHVQDSYRELVAAHQCLDQRPILHEPALFIKGGDAS